MSVAFAVQALASDAMPGTVRFDSFEVDLEAHQLYRRGARVKVRDQPLQVLAALLEHPGQVVTREQLQRRLWRDEVFVDFDNSLNTAVARLREALSDSADHPRYIETIPRVGYRFIGRMSVPAGSDEPAGTIAPKTRVMVLPFVNSSGEPSQEYFSDAITDEIITELSALAPSDLGVIARSTAMRYKGSHKDVARIGREMAVAWIVEGSIRRTDDQVALTAQLIRAADQTHVFARRYDVALADIFDVERSIARAIGGQIGVHGTALHDGERDASPARLPGKPTQDLVAYDCYIQGRHYLDRDPTPAGWARARKYLEAALERDPRFALAHDALAELWWDTGFFALAPPKDTLAAGMPHAVRAVELDGGLAEAHAILAQYRKQVDFNWGEVEREMALALALNPWSAVVRRRRATTGLMPFGRLDEATRELEFSVALDPLGMHARVWLLTILWLHRQYDRAIEQGRLLLEIEPEHFLPHLVMGVTCREARRHEEAIAALRRAMDLSAGSLLVAGWLGLALAENGQHGEARALLDRLGALPAAVYVPPTSPAWIHLGLGQIDAFFEWMDRAIDARDHMIMPIKTYAFLDRVRDDPRFPGLLRKMNLA